MWQWQAKPAEWEVRPDGSIVLTEIAARDQFGVIVVFVIAGAVASLIWGFATTSRAARPRLAAHPVGHRHDARRGRDRLAGRHGAGPDRSAGDAVDPTVGDLLPSKLEIDGIAPFVVWPIFGVLGVLLSTWMSKRSPRVTSQRARGLARESGHHG